MRENYEKEMGVLSGDNAVLREHTEGCDNGKVGSEIGEEPFYTLQEAYDGGGI